MASADFVIENAGPGAMDARGLGFAALREARPDLVYVAISPFGQTGPYAHHLATDLTLSAMGGMMSLLGEPDRRPVRITVPQTWYHASVESALAALVAHQRALRTGEAQFVDVSVQAAVFWTGLNAMIAHSIHGKNIERNGTWLQLSTLVTPLVYPCADGEVTLIATTATLLPLIPWMIESGVVDEAWAAHEDWRTYEARMLTGAALAIPLPALREKIEQFTRKHTKADLFAGGIARGITLAPVNTVSDVLALDHLAIRDFWRPVSLADGRELRAAGPFVRMSRTPVELAPAPDLGQHTAEVMETRRAGGARRRIPPTPAHECGRTFPSTGVKFADFSWIGVGPITAKVFADHGATVVHVETDKPADRLRLVGPFKDGVAGINRCQFFASFNTSKLSLQLDLKHPEGIATAKRLLQWADVCLDSFTAGTMAELGLGYDVARELNPGLIMASTCLMGQTGPAAKLAGYGYHAASVCGFYEVTGWDDRAPGGPFNAYTDTIAPRFLATALIAALDHRRRTGEGQYIDGAQMEVVAALARARAARGADHGQERAPRGQRGSRRRAARLLPVPRRRPVDRDRGRDERAMARAPPRARRPRVGAHERTRHRRWPPRPARPDRPRAGDLHREARAARADGTAPGRRCSSRHGPALERPPGRSAARPPQLLPPAGTPGDGPRPLRRPRLPDRRLRPRPPLPGAVPRGAHLSSAQRGPRARRRRDRAGDGEWGVRVSSVHALD